MENDRAIGSEPPDSTQANIHQERARASPAHTERPPSAQHLDAGEASDPSDTHANDDTEYDSDPAEKIPDFDWDDLAQRYHAAMSNCEETEMQLMQEWESLMRFFKIWAESGHLHETDRTYSRLRTRMAHVQHSEESLEKKRLHYINVVKAFESAMNLLQTQFS